MIRGRKGYHKEILAAARKLRLREARIDGTRQRLADVTLLDRYREHDIDLVIGTFAARATELDDALARALRLGNGSVAIVGESGERLYSERLFCARCGVGFPPLDPKLFSFNSRQGACAACEGSGVRVEPDPAAVVDPTLSLSAGALRPWERPERAKEKRALLRRLATAGVPLDRPFGRLAARHRTRVLQGDDGVLARLAAASAEDDAGLDEFLAERPCTECHGQRLNARARAVRLAGEPITAYTALAVGDAERALGALEFATRERTIAEGPMREIVPRLRFLGQVGLGYLALDRRADTLSGGEAQRIRLAAQLGSNLRGICYVLDEPTIGLHPRDNAMLLDALVSLRERGNTVIVVEHDEATIRRADLVVDLGPGAGVHGGHVVAIAPAGDARRPSPGRSPGATSPHPRPRLGPTRPVDDRPLLEVLGASEHNLCDLDVGDSAGHLDVRHRRLGLGQVDAGARRSLSCRAARPRPTRRSCRAPTGSSAAWSIWSRAVEVDQIADRAHAAVDAGLLRRVLRRHPPALRAGARRTHPRLRRESLLLQRQGRALRRHAPARGASAWRCRSCPTSTSTATCAAGGASPTRPC